MYQTRLDPDSLIEFNKTDKLTIVTFESSLKGDGIF